MRPCSATRDATHRTPRDPRRIVGNRIRLRVDVAASGLCIIDTRGIKALAGHGRARAGHRVFRAGYHGVASGILSITTASICALLNLEMRPLNFCSCNRSYHSAAMDPLFLICIKSFLLIPLGTCTADDQSYSGEGYWKPKNASACTKKSNIEHVATKPLG